MRISRDSTLSTARWICAALVTSRIKGVGRLLVCIGVLGWFGLINPARAIPAFARQTGQACVACHVSFPELTPYGRMFKLSGYTIGTRQALPLALMAQFGVTHVRNNR